MPEPIITGVIAAGTALEKSAQNAPGPPLTSTELETGEMSPETLAYLTAASGGPISEWWSMLGARVRVRRWKRAIKVADEARAEFAKRGRAPREVDDSTLVPLLEAASLNDDETLAAKWSALLANATDPLLDPVAASHVDILRQLSHDDAVLFDLIYTARTVHFDPLPTSEFLSIESLQVGMGWEADRVALSLDNLLRQRLIVESVMLPGVISGGNATSVYSPSPLPKTLVLSSLGVAFAKAVRSSPPTGDNDGD